MPIKTFRITNAGPFDDITFEFDEHVNVFVGPNNSGKSTALLALAKAVVYPFEFPGKLLREYGNDSRLGVTIREDDGGQEIDFDGRLLDNMLQTGVSRLTPFNFVKHSMFIPSLRQSTEYRAREPEIHTVERLLPGGERTISNSTIVRDEPVIQKMVELDYLAYLRRQPQIRESIEMIAKLASEITEGYPIEYLGIGGDTRNRIPEFRTPDGDLPLNTLSQGTQSIIQWLAHFVFGYAQYYKYPENLEEKPAILIVDEIDAHLHPSWQRRIIPALTNSFPNLQIFCSTHSPLMLAGLSEGQVQLLNRERDTDGKVKVTVSSNPWDMAGWSAEEILRSVLGVRDTMDLTTASEIDRMGELSIKENLTKEEAVELEELRRRVSEGLLDGPASAQVESFAKFLNEVYSKQASRSQSSGRKRPRVRRRDSGGE